MKYYIATKLENHLKHNQIRDMLGQAGHDITYDWTVHGPVWQEGVRRISEVSQMELAGVGNADMVVVILPGGRGTHVKLGAAIGLGKPVVMLAECAEAQEMKKAVPATCAFYHHPLVIWVYTPQHLMSYAHEIAQECARSCRD